MTYGNGRGSAYPLRRMLYSSSLQPKLPTTVISALSMLRAAIHAMPAYLAMSD
jgi:hypothetical protein